MRLLRSLTLQMSREPLRRVATRCDSSPTSATRGADSHGIRL